MTSALDSPLAGQRIVVTGVTGLVGGAVAAHLSSVGAEVLAPTRAELDLRDSVETREYLLDTRPDVVIGCAATVGGIAANIAEPTRFLIENLEIQMSTLMGAATAGVGRFVFMASSCVYPRGCAQPMRESELMTGPLEPTNESYAVAKLAGIQLARSLMQENRLTTTVLVPCNIYGPGDTFDLQRAHVTSALVRRFVDAVRMGVTEVSVWGTGFARRELMHSADLASAVDHVLCNSNAPFIVNVGTGVDHSIRELAHLISMEAGFQGDIVFDSSFPDGMPQKVLDVSVLADNGWRSRIDLRSGVAELVTFYRASQTTVMDNLGTE